MNVATDLDLTVIEHLDFEPICEAMRECERSAAWLVTGRAHCKDVVGEKFLCVDHYEHLMAGGLWLCFCGTGFVQRDHIIRTERLKP